MDKCGGLCENDAMNLPEGPYEPKATEAKIYERWESSGFFNPDNLPHVKGQGSNVNYVVYMPLPNVTGSLHMGHALQNSLQDALVRYWRMRGRKALWLPGTDHAGIGTQYVVEKALKKEGISRFDLGREKFIERVWEWKKEYGGIILRQLRQLGVSADWSRERFTMDDAYAADVRSAFVHYEEKGLLYRGLRTVNWCTRCDTTLSELELEYEDEKTNLWYFKYPLKDEREKTEEKRYIVVATTRPETMLGDTAVAVNPKDERWKKFIGKAVMLPIQNREIPIVGDDMVETEFGTGAVKVTPAHDTADFEISQRHKLPSLQVIDTRGKMTKKTGAEFEGLKAADARGKVVEKMKELGLLEKTEEYEHRIAKCARCGHAIEPIPSTQWFVKMDKLAERTRNAITKGEVKIHPENFERTALAWLENVRDWTVSRQLWWGHRLPVWFCKSQPEGNMNDEALHLHQGFGGQGISNERYVVSVEKPKACPFCKECEMTQSEDVLDTWFSSALWPFAGLSESDKKKYYPGTMLMTARDIINLWISRMIFSGLEFMGAVPFRDVFVHGTILTKDGKRMSKSMGTGIDPVRYLEAHGADATRFALVWQANGQDIRWDETALTGGKKFLNKLWNAAKFVLMNTKDLKLETVNSEIGAGTEADEKLLSTLSAVKLTHEELMRNFEFSEALKGLYDFFWHDFCDIYIEAAKVQLENANEKEATERILRYALLESLILLHPFIPFITEEIYGALTDGGEGLLMVRQVKEQQQ